MAHSSLTRQEATTRAEQIEVVGYDVTVDLSAATDPQERTFGSRTTVRFTAEEGAETFIDFVHDSVTGVELNGEELDVDDVVDGSRIRLPGLGEANELTVTGRALYSRSGEGLHRFADPEDGGVYTYTQYEPADCRRVFAVFDQPDLKAAYTVTVITPPGWLAGSNGALTRTGPADASDAPGAVAHEFAPTPRISSYITTILAGPYTVVTDEWRSADPDTEPVPLALYCRRALAEHLDAQELFGLTKQGLDFFTELFAFPYPFGKYDQAFVPEYNLGAMENPGLVTLTEDYLFPSGATRAQLAGRANTVLHEMSHMWFGDLVTMRWWDDLWLKESFAEFMGAYAAVHATRYDDAWVTFALARKEWAYRQDQLPTTHPIVADIPDLQAARQNFDGITYAKGASVLKQLVAFVGEEPFMDACRAYFRRFAYGTTDLHDFLEVLEEACDADVRGWARAWLLTAGVPRLDAEVERNAPGAITALRVLQRGEHPRPHVVAVGAYAPDEDGTLHHAAGARVTVAADGAATPVPELLGCHAPVVLVNDRDLTYCLASPGPEGLATLLGSVERLADPLARALGHSQLWAAVRDGRLDPRDYVRLVARRCTGESHSLILTVVLDRAVEALFAYVPPRRRGRLCRELIDAVYRALLEAAPGSDAQLVLARTFARIAARDGAYAREIEAVLDGHGAIRGLALTPHLTWSLWTALVATAHTTRSRLDRAHRADNSRDGRLGYTRALAAQLSDESKAAAWESAVGGTLSNDELSATVSGFQLAAPAVARRYESVYFASVHGWWAHHSMEIATRLVRGLYPQALDAAAAASPEANPVAAATTRWLAEHPDAAPALRRIMTELLDETLRTLRLQAGCAGRV